ncbi:unnamed protein product [Arabis nemorensis]|uniref:Uncharacterized protein n=1 Tax=Arabis nemorensis TaxID=586526 RepID=A0A565C696_9BRAS|nr:unnamed protein product [Arabis nemorensis]
MENRIPGQKSPMAVRPFFEEDVEFVGVEPEGTENAMEQALKEGIVGEAGPLKRIIVQKVPENYIGDSGPRIMGIPLQSTVREAFNARDWSAQSRSRNGLIRNVKDLLRTYDPQDNNMRSDVYSWGDITQAGRGSVRTFQSWRTMMSWLFTRSRNGTSSTLKRIVAQATVYGLWKERNSRIHNGISLTSDNIFMQIDRSIRDTLLARRFRKGCCGLLSKWSRFS